jgi:heat shock protein 5
VFEVLGTAVDLHFGGNDFNENVVEHFANNYNKAHSVEISKAG